MHGLISGAREGIESINSAHEVEDPWALFPLVDLGLAMRESRADRASGIWDVLGRSAFRGQHDVSGRCDLLLSQAYLAYLLVDGSIQNPMPAKQMPMIFSAGI